MDTEEIKVIGEIEFHDLKVKVYHDPHASNENSAGCVWQARNPDSFYQGIMYMDNETGKCTYPEDAIIPEQTPEDREIIPKFVTTGKKEMDEKLISYMNSYLESDYKRRNKNYLTEK